VHQGKRKKKPPTGYHYQLNQIWARYERDMMKIWQFDPVGIGGTDSFIVLQNRPWTATSATWSPYSVFCVHICSLTIKVEAYNPWHGMKGPCRGGSYCAFVLCWR
jgi:hypothetical protein